MMNAKRILAGMLALCIMMSLVYIAPVQTKATIDSASTQATDETITEPETDTPSEPAPQAEKTYYLFGHINEADYGCEADHENMGEYKFEDGKLVATFTADSYVAVKEENNAAWYMFKTYCDDTSGTLYNTSTGAGEKMFIPGNMVITFTLVENEDGTLTLSYVDEEPECVHKYTAKTTIAATCVNTGLNTYTCSLCGDKYTEVIPATGHINNCKVNVATCQNYASYELTCTKCGNKQTLYANELAYQGLDKIPNGMDPTLFTTDPLYRYRTQKLATSLEPTMDGYDLLRTEWVEGGSNTVYYVASWPTGFDKTHELYAMYNNAGQKVTAIEEENYKLEIDSDKIVGYLYYHWCYEGYPFTQATGDATYNRFHAYYSTVSPSQADKTDPSDNSYRFDSSDTCEDSDWYFYVPVYAQTSTEYDKQYVFEQWSDWSEWSETPATATDSREVETISGYRYAKATLGDHAFADGFCGVCGVYDPNNIGYHLVGHINGADYGCEDDYATVGKYRFHEGKLVMTFTEGSYVFVKTSDNSAWYMSRSYVEGTTCTMYNTETGTAEKMFVPAGMEITFTLVENEDGSLYLSYVAEAPDCPHSYTSKITTVATCTETGMRTYTCAKCGHLYSEVIAAKGHTNECKVNDATCATYASYELTCTVCGHYEVLNANELLYKGLEAIPDGMDAKLFTNKPLYRYRTRSTATSYEPEMEGYVQVGTTWVEVNSDVIPYVKEWPAGFDTTNDLYAQYDNITGKVTESETDDSKLEIKSDKVVGYLYYHWCYDEHPNDHSSAVKDGLFVNFCAFYSTTAPSNYICDYTDMSYKVGYDNCSSSNWYFVVEVYGQEYGEFDKQYTFEKWSEWSDWSETAVTATSNREVETITGYRMISAELEDHDYINGICSVCNAADPGNIGYHLVGHINGADYGCEADHANPGTLRFINGKLVVTFTEDSYVFIKTSDNANWYMFQKYVDTTSGTLYNTTTGTAEKMFVPGGVEVTFTLVENTDGSLKLTYVAAPEECEHDYTSKVTTAPSCVAVGVRTFTCAICGDTYTEAIAATGHKYTSKVTLPTCTAAGYTTYTCSACGNSYTGDPTAAIGHNYVDGLCSNCGIVDPDAVVTGTGYFQVNDIPSITAGGKFVIVVLVNGEYKALGTTISSGKITGVDVTVVNGQVTGANLPVWTIIPVDDAIALSAESGFLSYTSSTNLGFASNTYSWTVNAGTSGFIFNAVEATRGIYYQLSTAKFGAYAQSNATNVGYASNLLVFKYQTGAECDHDYISQVTTAATCTTEGVRTFTCAECGDVYTESIAATGHKYVNGTCSVCGATSAVVDYYLVGYINGANYGCEEDHENLGEYKFVNGKLTVSFTADSYVFVKTGDNAKWYLAESYCTDTTCKLVAGATEKLYIPAFMEISFTLVENADGTLTLSYTSSDIEVTVPTLTVKNPTLAFKDEIQYNVYYTVDDATSIVEMGMVTFATRDANGTIENAQAIIPGYIANADGSYTVHSNGISARLLGDTLFFKVYAKLADGSYAYSGVYGYHAVAYAKSILNSTSSSAQAKALVVAMLNYGAAAQTYFNYKTDALMNASLTTAQQALVNAYNGSMVEDVVKVDSSKVGVFVNNNGYSDIHPTVSFQGAFSINYYFTPKYTPADGVTFYYWTAEDYNNADVLTPENATGTIKMTSTTGEYTAAVTGISARHIDQTIYISAVYNSAATGTAFYAPVIAYSLGAYCETLANNGNAFGAATAVYGYYAKAYFAS